MKTVIKQFKVANKDVEATKEYLANSNEQGWCVHDSNDSYTTFGIEALEQDSVLDYTFRLLIKHGISPRIVTDVKLFNV